MPLTSKFVLNALLRYNYLPLQKKDRNELPPVFSSVTFSPAIAKALIKATQRKGDGWDSVDYRLTRFNGVPRMVSIPHPLAYAHLCVCLCDNWKNLRYIELNQWSEVRPKAHRDGRIVIMDYENLSEKSRRLAESSFAKRFVVHTDVANCFPNIYSHAIPWATVGFANAKAAKTQASAWFNQLDKKVRWCKRNETHGIPVGPATSNIVTEAILARVDQVLVDKSFSFIRYIDDYTVYCESEDRAQEFVRILISELAKYKLLLNIKKTRVEALPEAPSSTWVYTLSLSIPKNKFLSEYDIAHFLSLALALTEEEPDGSVMKYAAKALLGRKFSPGVGASLLNQLLSLSFHYPILIPLLGRCLKKRSNRRVLGLESKLNALLCHHATYYRSDAMCWILHYLRKLKFRLRPNAFDAVFASANCLGLLAAYLAGDTKQRSKIIDFAKRIDRTDFYELDRFWLLLYELFRVGEIQQPYGNVESAFDVLKRNSVTFLNLRASFDR